MAVTDLSDGLPYWARQGQGYGGGPGPTGGPAAAPQGGPGSAAWLQYLMQMFGPGAAQAGESNPIATLNAGGTPPVPNNAIVPPVGPAASPPGPPMGPPQSPTPWFTGSNNPMPWRGPNPNAPAPAAQPVSAAAPVPGPLATGGATAQGASANPRFVQLDQGQNADPTGRNRGPQMTALNLAGLFGGGGAPGANPANVPSAAAQPVSALQGPLSNAPWTMGPQQKAIGWPKKTPYGPDWRDKAAGHSGYQ